ncbi:MAG: ester cyclase [Methanomicrobiaceae archaeon]|nr:ester cyclase [Methanomicrobiaceae archaeon]
MSPEEHKTLVRRFIDAYNARNLDMFDELVAPGYVDHTHGQTGRDSLKRLFSLAFDAFPDWHEHIEEMIAEGDRVWVRVTARGTHTGEWNAFGVTIPPTGRTVILPMVFIWRIADGKLVEGREVDDEVQFLKQLGLIEFTEKGKQFFPDDAV